ncbi:MAG: CRAL/TRIO domain-containing protein [Lentinula lateritia]|uniref:CRAL/TRIO domain-containing protein n=1 Tax=Lentinula lateritia TaxID=40482 RepID=A0ABQ8VWP4_9AGAR|nr:MAG: CRAL/TRIO domain-containing protein [Lentinula lateritia]KAJ4500813.1 CRAL/TRIO domain-containing protein [Lentinula lateritia]
MSNKVYEALPSPREKVKLTIPELKPEQIAMQEKIQVHFTKAGYTLPGIEKSGELMEEEQFWLSYECQLRYLRATKWKVDDAIKRLESTLKWRREFGLYTHITPEYIAPEAVTGKEILFGYDVYGRPAFYMIPSRQNTTEATRQIEFAVWMLERCIDLMDEGVESLSLLINFADKAKNPSMSTSRTVLSILQNHYPERLGKALVINVPYLVNIFFKLITPFIDPITVQKLKFNPDVVKDGIFAEDQVMKEFWGGNQDFEYDHEKYWPTLVDLCKARKMKWMDEWRKLGGKIGLCESDYKTGGNGQPVTDADSPQKEEADTSTETPKATEVGVPTHDVIALEPGDGPASADQAAGVNAL